MGCYNFLCPSLATPGGGKYFNTYLVVCAYNPLFYEPDSGALFAQSTGGCAGRTGRCRRRDQEPQQCIVFRTASSESDILSNALCGKYDKGPIVAELIIASLLW